MRNHTRLKWQRLLGLTVLLVSFISCKPVENVGGKDWAAVSMSIDQPEKIRNALAALSGSVNTAVILVFPDTVTSISPETDISTAYAYGLLDLASSSVTLSLPLNTSMRVIEVTFTGTYTLDQIFSYDFEPYSIGVSEPFTVTGSGTMTISITLSSLAEETEPTVVSTSPAVGATNVSLNPSLSVTFSESIDQTTITPNTDNTTCSGSIQLSADNFATCVQFLLSSLTNSSDTTVFTASPNSNLSAGTTYRFKVTTAVTNLSGQNMASTYNPSDGFSTGYSVGGTVAGLVGTDLVLQNSGGNDLTISTNGAFVFSTSLVDGAAYDVTVATQPSTGSCVVSSGSGTISASSVADVSIICLMGGAVQGTALDLTSANADVTTYAGNFPAVLSGSADGIGTAASFNQPKRITTDGTNLYVADSVNHIIRQIVISTGEVTTLAGSAGIAGSADATGPAASFDTPSGITTDGINLYVADTGKHTIRKIVISTAQVTRLAGMVGSPGFVDGLETIASFDSPTGITTDGTNLYVADKNNHSIRKIIISSQVVTTLAGNGFAGPADGIGTAATFSSPSGITTDGTNLFVADTSNHKIRQIIISSQVVTTLAGDGSPGLADGIGTAATFDTPSGITTDGTYLFVADTNNNRVRRIAISSPVITTPAGSTSGYGDAVGTAARFNFPDGIIFDGTNLFIGDTSNHAIRKISILP